MGKLFSFEVGYVKKMNFRACIKLLILVVRALSLPLVVIVHGNQESNASASILWDNAFSLPGRTLFHVPDKVKWMDLVETLSSKWRRDLNCRFDLSARAIAYLGQKIFRGQGNIRGFLFCNVDDTIMISLKTNVNHV